MTRPHCDWVFVRVGSGGRTYDIDCERCGGSLRVLLPVPVPDFIDAMNGFGKRHKRCRRSLRGERLQLLHLLRRRAKPEGGSFTITMGL